ncbi:MAG: hypothetical protein E7116_06760 [Bacteroidales bacterium]|nr:hypothetical protein [Bacteroidales bacterium]
MCSSIDNLIFFVMRAITLFCFVMAMTISCCRNSDLSICPDIVPFPQEMTLSRGTFDVAGASIIVSEELDGLSKKYIADFASHLSEITGVKEGTSRNRIVFMREESMQPSCDSTFFKVDQSYSIDISRRSVLVKAGSMNGFVYAVQTLKQMLPVEIYGTGQASDAEWTLPCCTVKDSPRFGYRGMLLDVSRYFSTVDEIKKFIDMMEISKMNVFHWHLTDDQGWRIEIKKYPELTATGSKRRHTLVGHHHVSNTYDGRPYGEGMWYSHEQVREVVDYAASKGITVIPEIDLPGHMMGALAAYPELGCTGGPYEVWGKWGISNDVLCAGKDASYVFLKNVLEEVCELFPSEYIHIGGDECPKTRWEMCPRCQAMIAELGLIDDERHSAEHYLQSHVMKQMSDFLAERGKKILCWEEVLQGEVAPGATVMAWRKNKYGHQAARLGHDAVMTTRTHLYLDRYQSEDKGNEPLAHSSYLPVSMVWSYDPFISEDEDAEPLTDEQKSHIIGIQSNVWREYIPNNNHLEYMVYPRMAAVAEVQWLMPENKDWSRFRKGLDKMRRVYDIMGYGYALHVWNEEQIPE